MRAFFCSSLTHAVKHMRCVLTLLLVVLVVDTLHDGPLTHSATSWAAAPLTITLGTGEMGEAAILVAGSGAVATLKDVQDGLAAQNQPTLLTETVNNGQHIWTLTQSLLVQKGVTLRITGGAQGAAEGAQVDWLRLRSDVGSADGSPDFYDHFVSLRTRDGRLLIQASTITSWDTGAGAYDMEYHDGRAYVTAKGEAELSISSSNLSYLGSSDGESYGVAWRDTGLDSQGKPRTRVTGQVSDSSFSYNYYGIYTFQAANMSFLRNKLFSNIQYGFDPHDFTHDVLVDGNEAYDNGSHGFIISRGCTKFIFRNNNSHDNKVKDNSKNPSAHGFMLDPGADPATAGVPQAPSTDNLFENNIASNNDGYGFRILQSNSNTIRNNTFTNNRAGISLEDGSTGNQIVGNLISQSQGLVANGTLSQGYGVQVSGGADANSITDNTISNNAVVGISLKTGKNLIQGNTIAGNATNGITVVQETNTAQGISERLPADNYLVSQPSTLTASGVQTTTSPDGNQLIGNTVRSNGAKGVSVSGANATVIKDNTLEANGASGISITGGTTRSLVQNNAIDGNTGYGVEIYGTASTKNNSLTRNLITNNSLGAISIRNGANNGISAPLVALQGADTITGTSNPGAVIEVFSDNADEAAFYEGTTAADTSGAFSFTLSGAPRAGNVTLTATDSAGNTSMLSVPLTVQVPITPTPPVEKRFLIYLPLVSKQ